MIRGSFFGLEIGRSGLSAAQFGLEVTGHNIANVDTAGFSRQSVRQANISPLGTVGRFAPASAALVGNGTRVQILEQIRSSSLDRRFRAEAAVHAYWSTRSQSLANVENFFDNINESTSINHAMQEFFRSMNITSGDSVSLATRVQIQNTAQDLVQLLRMNHEGLVALQEVENRAVVARVSDVNRHLQNIRELNLQIYNFEVTGLIANDLRDRRNLELDNLAALIDIEVEERHDQFGHSIMTVSIAGETAVSHDRVNPMSVGWVDNPIQGISTPVAIPVWANFMPERFSPSQGAQLPLRASEDREFPRQGPTETDAEFATRMMEYQWAVESAAVDMRRIAGGEIRAHMDVRDGTGDSSDSRSNGIPHFIEMVNDLARALFVEINNQHVQGWSDNPQGSETGIQFFSAWTPPTATNPNGEPIGRVVFLDADGNDLPAGTTSADPLVASARFEVTPDELAYITALNFNVDERILQNEGTNIAASSSRIDRTNGNPTELQRGNNENMTALYRIFGREGVTVTVGSGVNERTRTIGTFDDYGTVIRLNVASTRHTARQFAENSRILTLAADNQRNAIAGVSLDEEMVGLVRFQHAYNGAARVITAIDEALDRLINGTGRVGL